MGRTDLVAFGRQRPGQISEELCFMAYAMHMYYRSSAWKDLCEDYCNVRG